MGMLAQMGEGRGQPRKALKVSKRSALPPFLALDVMRKAGELSQAGEDIVHLEVGQPSSAAPKAASHALIAALEETPTHGYSVAFGVMGLRARLAQHYHEWYDVRPHTDNIAVTVGSSTAFALAFMAAFDEGDRIALPTPGYPAYRNLMEGLGLQAVPLTAGPDQGWRPMLAEMESWETLPDGLMIASPSNPTGVVLSDSELAEICRWCDARGVRLISDEIYHGLVYGCRAETALNYTKNAIVINSMSKYFSMTGWRIGWMILPDDLVGAVEKLAQNLFISAPTPNQIAAIAAFDYGSAVSIKIAPNRYTRPIPVTRGMLEGGSWASRRFIVGVLAIQRVDGPSLAMLTHPSNSSYFLGVTRPGPLSCRAGHLAGVFFVTPRRVLVRAATRITRLRGPPWDRHSGTTPRSGGGAAGSRIP